MFNNIKKKIRGVGHAVIPCTAMLLALNSSLFTLSGCSDTWDEHYNDSQNRGTESLLSLIDSDPQLSDFSKLLKSTHLYNNNHRTKVTYADLLDADQSLTVWAPVNGSFNVDSLLALCQTAKGDSGVAVHFVSNHIARSVYNMNVQTNGNIRMFNDKTVELEPTSLGHSQTLSRNIPAKNGLLHKLSNDAPYYYNVYDAITSLTEYSHFGEELLRFERRELDEESSVVADIINGEKIYSDSVTYKYNTLFSMFDYINEEDSTFMMLAPSKEAWEPAYNEAKKYFNYGNMPKADSISSYWTTVALLKDLIYNENDQRSMTDSIFSTSFTSYGGFSTNLGYWGWPYGVYYNPEGEDGLLTRANVVSELKCSNGVIKNITKWPFDMKNLYFRPISVQSEATWYMTKYTDCSFDVYNAFGDSISGNSYLYIKSKSNKNWDITYQVPATLSGTYDVCLVVLPKTVYQSNSRDFRPNKLTGSVTYPDVDGEQKTVAFSDFGITSGVTVDTIKIGRVTLPVCNYGQKEPTVSVKVQCTLGRTEVKYSRDVLLDCVYMKPVNEEDLKNEEGEQPTAVKPRKEVSK